MEERLSRLETIVEYHEKMISEMQGHIKTINDEMGEVRSKLSGLEARIEGLEGSIKESNRRYMTYIALIFTLINIALSLLARFWPG